MFQKNRGGEEKRPDSCLFYGGDLWIYTIYQVVIFCWRIQKITEAATTILINSATVQFEVLWVDPLRLLFEYVSLVSRDSRTLLDNVFVCGTMWDLYWRFYKKDLRTYGCNSSESSTHANETPFRYEAFMMPMNPLKNSELELGRVRYTSGIDWHVPRGRGLILRATGWCQSQKTQVHLTSWLFGISRVTEHVENNTRT